ncbi:hypothetical protein C9I98_02260 [Photobacterium sanctipauli]|uniref:Porin n=1 Tax=Photobacterium sanctipauli TaxID=1342794 RepID=A0A2T3P0V9_9GAMM|nr:hypothetical protein [Photobacterium sanctipauli]PSW22108.1 hypothetical protein C9I98_02260 [Photobacterium sanctipauli]
MKHLSSPKLIACASLLASSSAMAAYVEIGNEYEDWGDQPQRTNTMPYVAFEFNPLDDSSLFLYANFSYRHMDLSDERTWNNRARQDLALGFSEWYEDIGLWWGPKLQIRNEMYANDTRRTEYRFYNNLAYRLAEDYELILDGFIAPVGTKNRPRGEDCVGENGCQDSANNDRRENYWDYYHELDFGLRTQLAWDKTLQTTLYSEVSKQNGFGGDNRDWEENKRVEWQLRINYTQRFNDLTLTPFVRYTFHREAESVGYGNKDELRIRAGLWGDYKLDDKSKIVFETYYQTEDKENFEDDWNQQQWTDDYFFWKLAYRRDF